MTTGKQLATAIYNPHLLERSDLVASFVARHALFDELLDLISLVIHYAIDAEVQVSRIKLK